MAEDAKVTRIMGLIDRAKHDIMTLQDRWMEYYKLYRNWRDESNISGRSNVGIPLAFEWVEVVKSRLFDIFFGKRPYVRMKGREPTDDLPAKILQQYQNYQYDLAGYRKLGYDVLTQTLIYGTGIAKIFWKYEEQEKFVDVPIFPELPAAGTIPVKRKVPIYDNVGFDLVDVFDFNVDPEATCIEDAEWVAHHTRRTLAHLKEMEERGIYKNISEVEQGLQDDEANAGLETETHKQERITIEGHAPNKNTMLKPITVTEFYQRSDNSLTTIANGKHIIREQTNPYRHGRFPFVTAKIISTPHEFYGIGLIEAGAPSAKIMEDLLNNGLDSLNFSTNPIMGVDQTRVEDTELVSRPGGFFHTTGDPRTALFPLTIPDASQGTLIWFQLVNELAKKGTGIVDYLVGQTSQSKTATEASLMTNEAAKRIGMHIKIFGLTFIGPLAEMVYQLTGQFTTEAQTIRVTNMPGFPYESLVVTPDTFGASVDFVWESEDREMNNMVAVQQLMQILSISQTHPILAQFSPIIFEKVLEKYDMHENDELKQAAAMAKQMAPIYQQLVLQQMATQVTANQAKAGGGVGNAPRVAGGATNNVSQSVNAQSNPSLGNAPV